MLTDQINQLTSAIDKMKQENGQRWSIKQVVISPKNLEARLERLQANDKKDDLFDFEDLGIDYMFTDEAHVYKNNFTYTKIRSVAGISNASSQRAADMKMKCDYLLETYNATTAGVSPLRPAPRFEQHLGAFHYADVFAAA